MCFEASKWFYVGDPMHNFVIQSWKGSALDLMCKSNEADIIFLSHLHTPLPHNSLPKYFTKIVYLLCPFGIFLLIFLFLTCFRPSFQVS